MAILPTDIQILFTNYDIIKYFLNLASCSEHFISIKHRILATFNINKKYKINLLKILKKISLEFPINMFGDWGGTVMLAKNRDGRGHRPTWVYMVIVLTCVLV
jgi:hypothetical protein